MQKKKGSSLVTISIITVVTLFVWISIEGFQRFTKKDLKTVPEEIINPITPTLDKAVFEIIRGKKTLSPSELTTLKPRHLSESAPSSVTLEATPTPSPTEIQPEQQIATDSAQPQ